MCTVIKVDCIEMLFFYVKLFFVCLLFQIIKKFVIPALLIGIITIRFHALDVHLTIK